MSYGRPAFVTLTGIDRLDYLSDVVQLASEFPLRLECGVLISAEKAGTDRFPQICMINSLKSCGLRLSAHLCGSLADQVFTGEDIEFDLSGFSRVQVNLLGRHASPSEVDNAIAFGQRRGIRTIVQCGNRYPDDPRCDWLLDNSYGQGQQIKSVPDMSQTSAFCGISGGLTPGNVSDILRTSSSATANRPYWIDAESALIEAGRFSPRACARFLNQTFRAREHNGENT